MYTVKNEWLNQPKKKGCPGYNQENQLTFGYFFTKTIMVEVTNINNG